MLCLGRRLDEAIVIAGNIVIKVIAIKGGHVKLGIEAPREIPVTRAELLDNPPRGPDGARGRDNRRKQVAPLSLPRGTRIVRAA